MGSQFGRLFELHVARCHNSAKVINSFLCPDSDRLQVRALVPLCDSSSLDEFQQVFDF